jgi:hypothetical protein
VAAGARSHVQPGEDHDVFAAAGTKVPGTIQQMGLRAGVLRYCLIEAADQH